MITDAQRKWQYTTTSSTYVHLQTILPFKACYQYHISSYHVI
uniref:Uncharacterized protein n=1 Tax=Anguilla anguilla TaxID=7936 RepID=A0A0E9QPP7_ANGAN